MTEHRVSVQERWQMLNLDALVEVTTTPTSSEPERREKSGWDHLHLPLPRSASVDDAAAARDGGRLSLGVDLEDRYCSRKTAAAAAAEVAAVSVLVGDGDRRKRQKEDLRCQHCSG